MMLVHLLFSIILAAIHVCFALCFHNTCWPVMRVLFMKESEMYFHRTFAFIHLFCSAHVSVLKVTRRGHTLKRSVMATRMLKEAGFKVDHHYMPNSPGSTLETDLKMFQYVFASPDLQPDQVKIYPCIVNKYADLHQVDAH